MLLQRTNVEDSKSHQGAPVATAVERRWIDQFGSARKVHCVRHPAQKGCQRTVPAGFVGGAGVTPVWRARRRRQGRGSTVAKHATENHDARGSSAAVEIESVRLDRSVLARYLGSIGDLCDA